MLTAHNDDHVLERIANGMHRFNRSLTPAVHKVVNVLASLSQKIEMDGFLLEETPDGEDRDAIMARCNRHAALRDALMSLLEVKAITPTDDITKIYIPRDDLSQETADRPAPNRDEADEYADKYDTATQP